MDRTAQLIKEQRFTPEQFIYQEREDSQDIYFILDGKVEVFYADVERLAKKIAQPKVVSTLQKGQYFGESEFFTG